MANPTTRTIAIGALVVLAMAAAFGAYYQSATSTLNSQDQLISGLRSSVSSLQSHPLVSTSTVTSTTTQLVKTSSLQTTTNSTQKTITLLANVPFGYSWFVTLSCANCSGSAIGFSTDVNNAILFSCPSATATETCTVQFNNNATHLATSITMSYPQFGQEINQQNEPSWANCTFESYILPYGTPAGQGFGYCVQVAPAIFIIAQPFVPA